MRHAGAAAPFPPSGQSTAFGASSWASSWRRAYGARWWLDLGAIALVLLAVGAMFPLRDPDLPQHLAIGEWIMRHGRVPVVEPFAWTREGAPYFAYSHLLQVTYYLILSTLGPAGLRLLNGLLVVSAAAAVAYMGHVYRWRPSVALVVSAYTVVVALLIVGHLRPQIVLLTTVPLAWAFTRRLLSPDRTLWFGAGLLATSALAANSHLFFPLTAAPLALALTEARVPFRRAAFAAACVLIGWMCTPYALHWPDVFRLNFGYNALLEWPSPIREFTPGFTTNPMVIAIASPLALLPWGMYRVSLRPREQVLFATLWLAGLVAFGVAVRLLMVWWLLILPVAGLVLSGLTEGRPETPPRRTARVTLFVSATLLLVLAGVTVDSDRRSEGNVESRRLSGIADRPTEPVVGWLLCNTQPDAAGKVFTTFSYGSHLTWRLRGYSVSIDGRTIYPDSVARAETYVRAAVEPPSVGPWNAADLAILPTHYRAAGILDTASGWRRVAVRAAEARRAPEVGLWVNERWWQQWGDRSLPAAPQRVSYRTVDEDACSE